jgi:Flp pilus assembly protein TadG
MRPPLIQRPQRSTLHRTRERGVTMALVALAMVAIIAMAGLSIDIGTLYQASAEAQRAADAAALAAARTISMQGLTGDPTNASGFWSQICDGPTSLASSAAVTEVGQNPLSGSSTNPTVTVTYSYSGSSSTNCSILNNTGFGVNPQVTVLVTQTNLPTYFSRIWGRTGNTVGATATAEVFNPSNSNNYSASTDVVPVQPRCVKPWIVPNYDPSGGQCLNSSSTPACLPFVNTTTSALGNPGISTASGGSGGVIGERFWLLADCAASGANPCTLLGTGLQPQPQANYTIAQGAAQPPPNLEYVPGQVPSFSSAFTAIPACGSGASTYAQAIAGCDQSTHYQCGVQNMNIVDLSENPVTVDTTSGVECLIRQTVAYTTGGSPSGQDTLAPFSLPPAYPFQIQAGSGNPLLNASPNAVAANGIITSSNNIVSLPIYDSPAGVNTINPTGTTNVTIVGFLQVFINVVDANGNLYVTVLNVSGCGNGQTAPVSLSPVFGTSPVPVRLITPTPPSS